METIDITSDAPEMLRPFLHEKPPPESHDHVLSLLDTIDPSKTEATIVYDSDTDNENYQLFVDLDDPTDYVTSSARYSNVVNEETNDLSDSMQKWTENETVNSVKTAEAPNNKTDSDESKNENSASDTEIVALLETPDPKLSMKPFVPLIKLDYQPLWQRMHNGTVRGLTDCTPVRNEQQETEDGSSSESYGLKVSRSMKRKLIKNCKRLSVVLERLPSHVLERLTGRGHKRRTGPVRLPDIEQVRREHRQMLMAQVKPLSAAASEARGSVRGKQPALSFVTKPLQSGGAGRILTVVPGVLAPAVLMVPKSNAENCKEYGKRKKDKNKIQKVSETVKRNKNAINSRMYRMRKKMVAQRNQPTTNQVLHTRSTTNKPITSGSSHLLVTTDSTSSTATHNNHNYITVQPEVHTSESPVQYLHSTTFGSSPLLVTTGPCPPIKGSHRNPPSIQPVADNAVTTVTKNNVPRSSINLELNTKKARNDVIVTMKTKINEALQLSESEEEENVKEAETSAKITTQKDENTNDDPPVPTDFNSSYAHFVQKYKGNQINEKDEKGQVETIAAIRQIQKLAKKNRRPTGLNQNVQAARSVKFNNSNEPNNGIATTNKMTVTKDLNSVQSLPNAMEVTPTSTQANTNILHQHATSKHNTTNSQHQLNTSLSEKRSNVRNPSSDVIYVSDNEETFDLDAALSSTVINKTLIQNSVNHPLEPRNKPNKNNQESCFVGQVVNCNGVPVLVNNKNQYLGLKRPMNVPKQSTSNTINKLPNSAVSEQPTLNNIRIVPQQPTDGNFQTAPQQNTLNNIRIVPQAAMVNAVPNAQNPELYQSQIMIIPSSHNKNIVVQTYPPNYGNPMQANQNIILNQNSLPAQQEIHQNHVVQHPTFIPIQQNVIQPQNNVHFVLNNEMVGQIGYEVPIQNHQFLQIPSGQFLILSPNISQPNVINLISSNNVLPESENEQGENVCMPLISNVVSLAGQEDVITDKNTMEVDQRYENEEMETDNVPAIPANPLELYVSSPQSAGELLRGAGALLLARVPKNSRLWTFPTGYMVFTDTILPLQEWSMFALTSRVVCELIRGERELDPSVLRDVREVKVKHRRFFKIISDDINRFEPPTEPKPQPKMPADPPKIKVKAFARLFADVDNLNNENTGNTNIAAPMDPGNTASTNTGNCNSSNMVSVMNSNRDSVTCTLNGLNTNIDSGQTSLNSGKTIVDSSIKNFDSDNYNSQNNVVVQPVNKDNINSGDSLLVDNVDKANAKLVNTEQMDQDCFSLKLNNNSNVDLSSSLNDIVDNSNMDASHTNSLNSNLKTNNKMTRNRHSFEIDHTYSSNVQPDINIDTNVAVNNSETNINNNSSNKDSSSSNTVHAIMDVDDTHKDNSNIVSNSEVVNDSNTTNNVTYVNQNILKDILCEGVSEKEIKEKVPSQEDPNEGRRSGFKETKSKSKNRERVTHVDGKMYYRICDELDVYARIVTCVASARRGLQEAKRRGRLLLYSAEDRRSFHVNTCTYARRLACLHPCGKCRQPDWRHLETLRLLAHCFSELDDHNPTPWTVGPCNSKSHQHKPSTEAHV